MNANETTSTTPYQKLRVWGYVFSIGLTAVCLIAFLCTCVTKFPILDDDGIIVRTKSVFNPVSLVYLFSCIPSLAFGCLFSVVARIGENVQAMKDAQGGNEAVEAGNASQKKGEDFNITFLIVVAVLIVVSVAFVVMLEPFK